MAVRPATLLPDVIDLARAAGDRVAAEFARPDGPRFSDHVTAPVDHEIELFLRDRLIALLPARFVGEEAGVVEADPNGHCWVVDPHDGTRAFLEGKRGSAVSIALLRHGQPVLGVVYAPLSPDRGQDMIAWAEGAPITRNGVTVPIDLRARKLEPGDVVFLNHGVWQRPVWNSIACAPGRFMPLPSIAYRLARVAVGDGIATQTLRPVNALDIAAGHALLLAAGGVLVAEDGAPVTYNEQGESRPSACFGGAPRAIDTLRGRAWRGSTEDRRPARVTLDWPRIGETQAFDRAAGTLLGQAIGDSLGSLVEFRSAENIARLYPAGVRELRDGGTWNTIAGQITDDTELALALARSLIGRTAYAPDVTLAAYRAWYDSEPFDCGATIGAALGHGRPNAESQSNGALMRAAPIGIWARSAEHAAETARQDAALTHPHPVCQSANAAFAAAIWSGIHGADANGMLQAAVRAAGGCADVQAALRTCPGDDHIGYVLLALGIAFQHLRQGTPVEDALIRTVGLGGDTDTTAAITGALLGAAQGRTAFPLRWTMPVLTCRPDAGLGVTRPRPDPYWADDLIDIAEALLR